MGGIELVNAWGAGEYRLEHEAELRESLFVLIARIRQAVHVLNKCAPT